MKEGRKEGRLARKPRSVREEGGRAAHTLHGAAPSSSLPKAAMMGLDGWGGRVPSLFPRSFFLFPCFFPFPSLALTHFQKTTPKPQPLTFSRHGNTVVSLRCVCHDDIDMGHVSAIPQVVGLQQKTAFYNPSTPLPHAGQL